MDNNDIFRRLRYIFDFSEHQIVSLFESTEKSITVEQAAAWLKNEDDEKYKSLYDIDLASFLNGLINDKRGKRDGPQVKPEKTLNNNLILRKLKIALNYRDDDILEIMDLVDLKFSKHEVSAFFRNPSQKQYRDCKDQFLRNFLMGLQIKLRGSSDN